jgi:hypothetical protein
MFIQIVSYLLSHCFLPFRDGSHFYNRTWPGTLRDTRAAVMKVERYERLDKGAARDGRGWRTRLGFIYLDYIEFLLSNLSQLASSEHVLILSVVLCMFGRQVQMRDESETRLPSMASRRP